VTAPISCAPGNEAVAEDEYATGSVKPLPEEGGFGPPAAGEPPPPPLQEASNRRAAAAAETLITA